MQSSSVCQEAAGHLGKCTAIGEVNFIPMSVKLTHWHCCIAGCVAQRLEMPAQREAGFLVQVHHEHIEQGCLPFLLQPAAAAAAAAHLPLPSAWRRPPSSWQHPAAPLLHRCRSKVLAQILKVRSAQTHCANLLQ